MPGSGTAAVTAAAQQVGAAHTHTQHTTPHPPPAPWDARQRRGGRCGQSPPRPPGDPPPWPPGPSAPHGPGARGPAAHPALRVRQKRDANPRGTRSFRAVGRRGLPESGTCPPDPSRAAPGGPSLPRPEGTAPLSGTWQRLSCSARLRSSSSSSATRGAAASARPEAIAGAVVVRASRPPLRGGWGGREEGQRLAERVRKGPARPLLRERGEKRCREPHERKLSPSQLHLPHGRAPETAEKKDAVQ